MAKQNFLAGGYYGKLGVTVGQRWKNIRTIRSYVIPANPRTERQQANRGQFGGATRWAQIGMSMNYNATCFESGTMSRWNVRMRTARQAQDNGNIDLELIPLYPTEFVPPYLITKMEVAERRSGNVVVFTPTGTLPATDRVLSVMFHLYNAVGADLGYKLYVGNYKAGAEPKIEIEVDDLAEISEYDFVRLVSRDDVDSSTDLIGSPMLQVVDEAADIRDFNTTIQSVSKTLNGVTIVFAEPFKNAESTSFSGSIYGVSAGAFVEVSGNNLTLENNGGYFAVTIPCSYTDSQEILALPTGSEVRITSISAIGAKFEYTKNNETIAYDDTDLTRSIARNFTFNASEEIQNRVFFNLAVSGSQSLGNGACVFSGRFDDRSVMTLPLTLSRYSATRAQIGVGGNGQTLPARTGDYITIPAFNVVSNGVTYSLSSSEVVNVTNNIIQSNWLLILDAEGFDHDGGGDSELISMQIQFNNIVATQNDSITAPTTNDMRMVVGTGARAEFSEVVDVWSDEVKEEGSIILFFSFSEEQVHALNESTYANGSNWYVMHKNIRYTINYNTFPQTLNGWR